MWFSVGPLKTAMPSSFAILYNYDVNINSDSHINHVLIIWEFQVF